MKKKEIVNWLLFITLIIVFVSGVLIHPLGESVVVVMVHKLSAVIFVICNIVHVLQHAKRKGSHHVS